MGLAADDSSPAGGAGVDVDVDVDVLIIGAGIIGIYQLYRAREAGFDVRLLEAGGGVGGVWYWNRYPQARFDSESYTYGYLFSKELFRDWHWTEHFAGQPEIERYLNHVVDRFGLRRHMQFGTRVTAATYDESSGTWTVRGSDGTVLRARIVISATGGLSVPFFPDVPGREDFRGVSHHTGLWPRTPVDFEGKRVAVVGTGPSGVQIVPAIVDDVASLTIYQRTPNWCTPLNNRPITQAEQAELRENFDSIRRVLSTSPSGFLHQPNTLTTEQATKAERLAFYETMWQSFGFSKLSSNYTDITTSRTANAEWCQFIADKIRGIVNNPDTAEKLIPKDHWYGAKRTPFVTGYYESFNKPSVSLVDLKATPMLRVTETGIETAEELREFDIIVWATGFDFGTGALTRMGVSGRSGLKLAEHWTGGPTTYLGFMCHGFPNFFFPGGPHGAGGGNFPRYGSDQVDFITGTLVYMRSRGHDVIEAPASAEESWMSMVSRLAPLTPFSENHSHYYGANIPGKPRRYLLNPAGRGKLHKMIAEVVASDYAGFMSCPAVSQAEASEAVRR